MVADPLRGGGVDLHDLDGRNNGGGAAGHCLCEWYARLKARWWVVQEWMRECGNMKLLSNAWLTIRLLCLIDHMLTDGDGSRAVV